MMSAAQCDDGHAHIKSFAGRGAADVRERVERDIDVVVLFEIIGAVRTEFDAFNRETQFAQPFADDRDAVVEAENFALQNQPRIADGVEDGAPQIQQVVGDLGEIIKATESDVPVTHEGRLSVDVGRLTNQARRET